jgi:hypothetical protein
MKIKQGNVKERKKERMLCRRLDGDRLGDGGEENVCWNLTSNTCI